MPLIETAKPISSAIPTKSNGTQRLPETMKCWTLTEQKRFSFAKKQGASNGVTSLTYHHQAPLPLPLGDTEGMRILNMY